jgi:hypothetical protein
VPKVLIVVLLSPEEDRGPPLTIMLTKDGAGLGFSLEGGKDSPLGDKPLTIKKIFTGKDMHSLHPGCKKKVDLHTVQVVSGSQILDVICTKADNTVKPAYNRIPKDLHIFTFQTGFLLTWIVYSMRLYIL